MISHDEVVLGQYEGYRDDPTVPNESNTPTFASVILRIHNERWEGVPFILKAGKALNSRKTEIRVDNIFKDVPHEIFQKFLVPSDASEKWVSYLPTAFRNYLHEAYVQVEDVHVSKRTEIVLLAGKEGITIQDATENLILDTIRGDQQQFVHRDELEASRKIFISLLHRIDRGEFKPLPYETYVQVEDVHVSKRTEIVLLAGKEGVTIQDAIENLILDTIRGDQQQFVHRDELEASWKIFISLLHRIDRGEFKPLPYEAYVQVEDVHVSKRTEIVLLAGKEGVTIQDATENLILDTIRGDQQQFVHRDELEVSWKIFISLLHRIDRGEFKPLPYEAYVQVEDVHVSKRTEIVLLAGKEGITIQDATENLILDTIRGDQQQFVHRDELEKIFISLLHRIDRGEFKPLPYEAYVQVEDVHVSKRTEIVLLAGKEGVTIQDATENLILDTIRGDQQQFVHRDELEVSWKIFISLLHRIDRGEFKPLPYEAYVQVEDVHVSKRTEIVLLAGKEGITIQDATENLILDTIRGDQQQFVHRDELEASRKIFISLLHRIDRGEFKPLPYETYVQVEDVHVSKRTEIVLLAGKEGVTIQDATENLILDTIRGDQQQFVHRDELEKIFISLLHRIDRGEFKPLPYEAYGRGSKEAVELLQKASYVETPIIVAAGPPILGSRKRIMIIRELWLLVVAGCVLRLGIFAPS
ncbi:hypothetical protein Ahy_A02g009593 [Arachis hypogaea]|uniref:glucose-6-phosphate dehydrogenase (NADP(+)) n=1 Tax=Arachis hypogaea TaxID=3818 RepID=A0A445EHR2_ARAHY|nr:hypothetical protein Ahy_A02g009593 [Arachis hypogaea]